MKNLIVKICVGAPGCGKSTWAKNFIKKNENWVRGNRDDYRHMLLDQPTAEPKIESLINDLVDHAVMLALSRKLNVILDNTHLKSSRIDHIIELVQHLADVEFQIFDISLNKVLERNLLRENQISEHLLKEMFDQYKYITDSFDFSNRKKKRLVYKKPDIYSSRANVILCDIDGTLAHMSGKRGPYDWDLVDRDDLDEILAERLRKHSQMGEKVILVTGREESCRKMTKEWLDFYSVPYYDLLMRKTNDSRKDSVVKKEIYLEQIKDVYDVEFVYDDRDQVIKMWRSLGLKVFQVAEGTF